MKRRGETVCMVLLVALVIIVCKFYMSAVSRSRLHHALENSSVSRSEMNGNDRNADTVSCRRRRHSTSDEMRYILYGDNAPQTSVYDQLLDYIRVHVTLQSPTRPRRLERTRKFNVYRYTCPCWAHSLGQFYGAIAVPSVTRCRCCCCCCCCGHRCAGGVRQ